MLNSTDTLSIVSVVALVTFLTRVLPFCLLGTARNLPSYISFLGKYLPFAIIGMLVVYCFKETNLLFYPHGMPEILAALFVIMVHSYKGNLLLSIVGGTLMYMLLVQKIF